MTLSRWGLCSMADSDGQFCSLKAGHKGPHAESGLRAWLETTTDDSIIRTYAGASANESFQMEARLLARFGFNPVSQSGTSMTTGPGMGSILALGILAFGRRTSSSTISVMFRRSAPVQSADVEVSASSIPDQIRAIGELRDAGYLTLEEFEAKKAELLSRL